VWEQGARRAWAGSRGRKKKGEGGRKRKEEKEKGKEKKKRKIEGGKREKGGAAWIRGGGREPVAASTEAMRTRNEENREN
jgi:hypothetical protein